MKDKFTAAILAFLLGGIGVHRFYLGQAGLGIVYLLLSWTTIPFFIALLDTVIFLLMSRDSFDRKYNYRYAGAGNNNVQTTTVVNNIHTAPPAATQAPVNPHSHMDALERLHDLKQKGILSEEEFAREKSKILNKNGGGQQYGGQQSGSGDPFLGR